MIPYSTTTLAALCIRTLDNLKATNIIALDLRALDGSPSDYFLICTATSDVHARALADAVTRTADTAGYDRPKMEGRDAAEWVLLDFFDIAVHIFRSEAREYYKLEKLWGDAPQVDIIQQQEEASKPKKKVTSRKTATKAAAPPKKTKTTKVASAKASKDVSNKTNTTKKSSPKIGASAKKPSTKKATAPTKTITDEIPKKRSSGTK
jgi:ribosome-associated protein